jgi:hypothetical protein
MTEIPPATPSGFAFSQGSLPRPGEGPPSPFGGIPSREVLLRTAFGALYARGLRGADLQVDADSLTGETGPYTKVGMTAHPRFATWEKELGAGPA